LKDVLWHILQVIYEYAFLEIMECENTLIYIFLKYHCAKTEKTKI
jgi:hypothetical protein